MKENQNCSSSTSMFQFSNRDASLELLYVIWFYILIHASSQSLVNVRIVTIFGARPAGPPRCPCGAKHDLRKHRHPWMSWVKMNDTENKGYKTGRQVRNTLLVLPLPVFKMRSILPYPFFLSRVIPLPPFFFPCKT